MLKINTENIYKSLKAFYTLTNIHISIFDTDFREIISYPRERFDFCQTIRKNPVFCRKCQQSDQSFCKKCAKSKELIVYRCHAGLMEAVTPIFDKQGVLGYAMFGQVLQAEDCEKAKELLLQKFPKSLFPDIENKILKIPVKSTSELTAAATVLQALVAYLLTNQWVTPEKSRFIRQLDDYILSHIDGKISVEDICRLFHIGRSRLYCTCNDYLGCGLADYIRHARIEEAKRLLTETEMDISAIAYSVGFSDYSHFARVFKSICGVAAREYRSSAILDNNRENL